MCVCVRACVHACVRACVRVRACAFVCMRACARARACVCVWGVGGGEVIVCWFLFLSCRFRYDSFFSSVLVPS